MRDGAAGQNGDYALSEVIGFVLIIAIIIAAFSLYLTYGVPAQGRENEIVQMNAVNDQFVDYKIGLDSLFTNNKVGTTVSNSFTLGTEGGHTQGTMSVIPIMSPVKSTGILSVDLRTTYPETLDITSQSLILNSLNLSARTSVDLPTTANYTLDHVYANISIPSSFVLNRTGNFGMTVNTTRWVATVNLTPQSTLYQWYKSVNSQTPQVNPCGPLYVTNPNQNGTAIQTVEPQFLDAVCLVPMNEYNYTGTDLTISITKGNIITMTKYPVYKNVVPGNTYSVDLMDSTYGLNSVTAASDFINLKVDQPLSPVTGNGNITYNFIEEPYTITPIPLGAIEYQAQNNYWISQDYYYQMGGVFLSQIQGNNTYKLPPEISFSTDESNPAHKIITVNINAVSITDPYGGSAVGGNSPVQIKTTLDSVYPFPYATGTANTRWIRIGINTTDDQARAMWTNYFSYSALVADLPSSTVIGNTTTESFINISGFGTDTYGINVIASNATYTAAVYGVGG